MLEFLKEYNRRLKERRAELEQINKTSEEVVQSLIATDETITDLTRKKTEASHESVDELLYNIRKEKMMPFGPYVDFKDCVAKNQDKASPEGFCAWLHKQITGVTPAEMTAPMPPEAWGIYLESYSESMGHSGKPVLEADKEAHAGALSKLSEAGWTFARMGWVKQYVAPSFRTLAGVRIFASGEWTDSQGITRTWTDEDLDGLAAAFNAGVPGLVPIKAGHTPDTFNSKIAEKLGVPVEVVTGDLGKGQISLGRMATLERRGSLLMASFERVPEPIADLVDAGLFSTVSVEIEDNIGGFASAVTGVAMLGAEEPAVDDATLDRALVFGGKRQGARVFTFGKSENEPLDHLEREFETLREKMSETIKGMRGAPIFRAMLSNLRALFDQLKKKSEHQNPNTPILNSKEGTMGLTLKEIGAKFQEPGDIMANLAAIAAALGLGEEATLEDIVAAIGALKGQGAAPPAEAVQLVAFQKTTTELQTANTKIAILERKDRISGYLEQTRLFTAIPGKTSDVMAVELADIEDGQGIEKAKEMLTTYQGLNKMGEAALRAVGSSRTGTRRIDFEGAVTEYQKANPTETRVNALKAVMRAQPALYREYTLENDILNG